MTAGHRVWRQVIQPDGTSLLVEIENPRPRMPEDLRFDGNFISPIDGAEIRNKRELNDHNRRHGTIQILPGMDQDQAAVRQENRDAINGKVGREERTKDIIRAIEIGEQNA